jgi:hypothetical protein
MDALPEHLCIILNDFGIDYVTDELLLRAARGDQTVVSSIIALWTKRLQRHIPTPAFYFRENLVAVLHNVAELSIFFDGDE